MRHIALVMICIALGVGTIFALLAFVLGVACIFAVLGTLFDSWDIDGSYTGTKKSRTGPP